ncbi:helix-turn-helix domain-containing protein [Chitinophaga sp. LS1]|uniref:helix-turn-helix domain-containing protein n=1 Tax=Chitinophaga sp. LS1 TaxID=3051176 RepID=UPI0039EFD759
MEEFNEEHIKVNFGKRIRDLRNALEKSQPDLAYEADLSPDTVSRIELGKVNPTLTTIIKLANALNVEIWELIKY